MKSTDLQNLGMPERTLLECVGNLAVTRRPLHLRPPTAFCLPLISMSNDYVSGHALKHLVVTSVFDSLNPYVGMPYQERQDLNNAINVFWERNTLEPEQIERLHRFALELQIHLTGCFNHRVMLDIYGSSHNGFGTRMCDVDISLSFAPSPPEWATSSDRVMRAVAKALVDFPKAIDEHYVNAKVPIVRFRSGDMDLEADISYKNDLALHNTALLQQYCKWDIERLPVLGVWIKQWAKRCGIGEASKGALSSYAWIVMLIHYLQQLEPSSVLPCLQEVPHSSKEDVFVNGYNVYYYKSVEPSRSRACRASVLDLFVGFLDYYSSYFNFQEHTVQIATRDIEDKPKRWSKFVMCIADPFEVEHNLAQGVDQPMFNYIRSCMEHSKSVFTSRKLRNEFLTTYNVDDSELMDADTAHQYGEFLLQSCVMMKQAPIRQFRDRSMSQSTSTSNTSISS